MFDFYESFFFFLMKCLNLIFRSECDSSAVPNSGRTFLLDSLDKVNGNKSVQKGFCKEHLSNKSENNASRTPQLSQTMSRFQKFPQDDTLSPKLDSPSCAELLKKNLPTSKSLHSLRMKIQQQKLKSEIRTPASVEKDRRHLTRKVCRVTNKGLHCHWTLRYLQSTDKKI